MLTCSTAMVKGTDVFPGVQNPEAKVKEVKSWLNSKGVRDFEPVSLFCDQLGKVTVKEIEAILKDGTAYKTVESEVFAESVGKFSVVANACVAMLGCRQ